MGDSNTPNSKLSANSQVSSGNSQPHLRKKPRMGRPPLRLSIKPPQSTQSPKNAALPNHNQTHLRKMPRMGRPRLAASCRVISITAAAPSVTWRVGLHRD